MKLLIKINLISHIKQGSNLLFGAIMCIATPYIIAYWKGEGVESLGWIGIIVFLIFILPGIIIHLNYYTVNKGDVLKYAYQERKISIIRKGVSINFSLDDIEEVVRYMSFNFAANRSSVLPWDGYNHAVVHLKNGREFTITSLLVPNLNIPIEGNRITIKRRLYRLAKKC